MIQAWWGRSPEPTTQAFRSSKAKGLTGYASPNGACARAHAPHGPDGATPWDVHPLTRKRVPQTSALTRAVITKWDCRERQHGSTAALPRASSPWLAGGGSGIRTREGVAPLHALQ